ncbi:MAG: nicotinate-nucleotide adenylyltransferase [Deltaproteobacteria bacterium]|nr:nicotinate-nucleotide adenylyltransferase [Deltaproteobacteria bacterium]
MKKLETTANNNERIGLFGGTFNPIHWAHLRAAEEIQEYFQLKKVIFIPARYPPHKNGESIVSPGPRLQMVNLAIDSNPAFATSDFEIKRNCKSFSIFTIEYFRKELGPNSSLFFLMGMDSFLEISTWKDFARLFSLANFIIMSRPGYLKKEIAKSLPVDVANNFHYNSEENYYVHPSHHKIFFQEITLLDIASSEIRSRIKNRHSIRYLVPPIVEDYIKKYKLYQN